MLLESVLSLLQVNLTALATAMQHEKRLLANILCTCAFIRKKFGSLWQGLIAQPLVL